MRSATNPTFREFNAVLRRAGFQRDYISRAGGCRIDGWKRQENERRTIIVQLWDDGQHRATHSISGRQTTHPTEFADVPGMLAAINVESERQDNKNLARADG